VGDFSAIAVAGEVQTLTRTANRWTFTTYTLPALVTRESYPVPIRADADPDATLVFASSVDDRLVITADGLLSIWDRRARLQAGAPEPLGQTPDEQRAFRRASARLRPGRPDQVLVVAPDQPVLVYDLTERRIVAELPVPSATGEMVVDATGSRMAVRTAQRTIELWDIDAGRRAANPIFAPDASTLMRFSDDGYLVTTSEVTDTVQWWDVDRGALSGTIGLAGRFADPRDRTDPLFLSSEDGMPGRLPLTAQVWADRLCAVVGDYTDAERAALPAGTQDRRPCP
jgi:hypothetical protein